MNYVTPAQLAERPGAQELAQVATAAHQRVVDSELMEATLRGGDRSAWTPAERAVADDALARVEEAVVEACSVIDGFLVQRGYSLPLAPVPPLVAGWARDIARYKLHKDRGGLEDRDPIARAYRDAMKLLQMTAAGQFSLGGTDPIVTDPNSVDVRFDSTPTVFNRDQLRRFR